MALAHCPKIKPKSIITNMDTGDPSYLGANFLLIKNRTLPCPSPSANLVGIRGNQEEMSNLLILPIFRYLLCLGNGKQTFYICPITSAALISSNYPENRQIPTLGRHRYRVSLFIGLFISLINDIIIVFFELRKSRV